MQRPSAVYGSGNRRREKRTRRQALPKLLGLVGVLQDEGVEVLRASDLELGLRGPGVLLDPGGCMTKKFRVRKEKSHPNLSQKRQVRRPPRGIQYVQLASLRRQISMN